MVKKCVRNWLNGDRDYKIISLKYPDTNKTFYYVYHYELGISAIFKNKNDIRYWLNP